MKGKPCGASHISANYVCRIGGVAVSDDIASTYARGLKVWKGDAGITAQLEKFESAISDINPEGQEVWRSSMNDFLEVGLKSSKVNNAISEVSNQPLKLVIAGEVYEAPPSMEPWITKDQFKWRNPTTGTLFNKADDTGLAETTGVGLGKSVIEKVKLPYIEQTRAYKAELEAAGSTWPAPRSRVVTDKEVDEALAPHKNNLWFIGGNTMDKSRKRNELIEYYEYGNKEPSKTVLDRRESKEKAMVRAWLEYDKKSPITGKPVPLPNTEASRQVKGGGVTVDHIKPMKSVEKLSVSDKARALDVASNYMIVEQAPNNWKGSKASWEAWYDRDSTKTYATLSRDIDGRLAKASNTVTIPQSQFSKRYLSLNPANAADLKAAAMSAQRSQGQALLTGGGSKLPALAPSTLRSRMNDSAFEVIQPKAARTTGPRTRTQSQASARSGQTDRQRARLVKAQEKLRTKKKKLEQVFRSRGKFTAKQQAENNKLANDLRQIEKELS